jgi:hypothetical protein|tara:strand:- start:626 stop:1066 length:441 start_codon:yes stop_codon:yes gene_type:complete
MTKSIETLSTLSTSALLNELISRGILSQSQSDSAVKKSDRAAAKAEKAAVLNTLKTEILEAITGGSTRVFSVKTTGNSTGVMDLVQGERSQILKALTALTADGVFRKVGLVGGVEKATTEVNAFQIRYIFDSAVKTETEEAAEEVK